MNGKIFRGPHYKNGALCYKCSHLVTVAESHSWRTLLKLNKIKYFNIKSPVLDYTQFIISYKFEAIAFFVSTQNNHGVFNVYLVSERIESYAKSWRDLMQNNISLSILHEV